MSSMEETQRTLTQPARGSITGERPTRVRYGVLGFVCSLAMITYLDRLCLASAVPSIIRDLHLNSAADLRWVFSAFALAYSLFEVPNGWLGDMFGPRKVLIRIVLWWSVFAALTGTVGLPVGGYMIGGVGVLVIVQFLFGAGEAGAFPNITRALHNWFPFQERGLTQGAVWMSGRMMGGLTPFVWFLLIEKLAKPLAVNAEQSGAAEWVVQFLSWRGVFWVFGLIGAIWCVFFALWFRSRPEEKPQVNAAELAWIKQGGAESMRGHAGVPWRRLFSSANLWALCLMYFCQSYGWFFYISYLPNFFEQHHGVPRDSLIGAFYKGGPLWMGAFGCLLGGVLSDWFIRRTGNRRWGRRLFGMSGHALTAVCFLLCPLTNSAFSFFVVISLAGFCTDLSMGADWATCQDIGRRYAAIVAGCMNMIGNLGGALCGWLSGYIVQLSLNAAAAKLVAGERLSQAAKMAAERNGYNLCFLISAGVYVLGVLCWSRIDATEPVAPEAQ